MCDPMTIAAVGMTVVSGGAQTASQISQASAINRAADRTYRSAIQSQANQQVGIDRRTVEENRQLQESGYDLALQEAAARSSVRNQGASRGVAGVSLDALIAEQERTGSVNQRRIEDRRENSAVNRLQTVRAIRTQTQDRIDNTPTAEFGLLDYVTQAAQTGMSIVSALPK